MLDLKLKTQAAKLRTQGFSLAEIATILKISKSTASLWLRTVNIGEAGLTRLKVRRSIAANQAKATKDQQKNFRHSRLITKLTNELATFNIEKIHAKILCAFLFWAEGSKGGSAVSFINSDPLMVQTFLELLRKGFTLDERKFRVLLHLHAYHDESEMIEYWSDITKIPIDQFSRSYIKSSNGRFTKDGYKGCLRIRYYNVEIARELKALYNTTARHIIGV